MQLETISINGFRSIEGVTLHDCGGFNVLIGKNNAGKSNILLAIHLFFAALRDQQAVVVGARGLRAFDHFGHDDRKPVEFTFDFRLALAERDSLIQEIVSGAPHVKNAVEGMDPSLRLRVTVAYAPQPRSFSYVKELVLHKQQITEDNKTDATAKSILRIDASAAEELAKNAIGALSRENDARFIRDLLDRMDRYVPDDWERFRMSETRGIRYLSHDFPGSRAGSAEIMARLEQTLRASESKVAFRETAEAIAVALLASSPSS